MPTTRLQAGESPKKTQRPGYVETPHRHRRSLRHSSTPDSRNEDSEIARSTRSRRKTQNGSVNYNGKPAEAVKNSQRAAKKIIDGWEEGSDPRLDQSPNYEFGGTLGVSALMLGFPLLMYYMWIGTTYYDGKLPLPNEGQSLSDFAKHLGGLAYDGAFPHAQAWAIYWGFFVFEALCYLYLPGIYATGKPLPHEKGKQLTYYCSGVWSFYATIAAATILHVTGLFKLETILDEFGPIMSVAIISGFLVSIVAYASAIFRGAEHRMTGHRIYDFFMGAELNPRMFGLLDFKMFFEVRIPWFMLFLISLATATRQYEQFGWVSAEVGFLVMAHFLYANACAKGEELIVTTWDIYYEKWGFMLIFWNLAGVPLSYCLCSLYLGNHAPSVYRWNRFALTVFYVSYLFMYWVWDTANSQKNRFRHSERGTLQARKTFPQLPWGTIQNPKSIETETGDSILVDGWYKYARKIHYTADLFFALSWGLITGFRSLFPWFYPVFFACMIVHRALRDLGRCKIKYGEAWEEYERRVPYIFVPVSVSEDPEMQADSLLYVF